MFGSDAGTGRVNFSFEWMVLMVHVAAFPHTLILELENLVVLDLEENDAGTG